jgi:hypothetical protein
LHTLFGIAFRYFEVKASVPLVFNRTQRDAPPGGDDVVLGHIVLHIAEKTLPLEENCVVMRILQIICDTPEAIKFVEYALSLPFICEKKEETTAEHTPPCSYATVEEFRAAVFEGMDDIRAGRSISHEDMGKHISQLR